MKRAIRLLACCLMTPALAGEPDALTDVVVDEAGGFVPAFDALSLGVEWLGEIDFDNSPGELRADALQLRSFLNKPFEFMPDWYLLGVADYSLTRLDFGGTAPPPGFPLVDEDLHQLGLHGIVYRFDEGSKWIYGGWARVNLATDFQHVDGDDFYYDVAIGAGYLFNERLLIGAGIAGLQLTNDGYVLGGPGFYWKPNDAIDVFLLGVLFNATWRPTEDWAMVLRVRPFGDNWNIEHNGLSRQVDMRSYTVRLHAEHRLVGDLWLSAGVGWSFANRLEYRKPSGLTLYHDHLDGGPTAAIELRLRTW